MKSFQKLKYLFKIIKLLEQYILILKGLNNLKFEMNEYTFWRF